MSAIDVYGIFVPSLLVMAIAAFAATALLRRLLDRIGFYRLVWHPALFDLALFGIVLGAVFLMVHGASAEILPFPNRIPDAPGA